MPSSVSGGSTLHITGWNSGAYRKLIPISSIIRSAAAGVRLMLTPSASKTSALPDRLEIERLPCFATGMPAAAATMATAVEILKVERPPPVPQVSIRSSDTFGLSATQLSRIACAIADISLSVGPFIISPIWKPAICTGLILSSLIARINSEISAVLNSCPPESLFNTCFIIIFSPVICLLLFNLFIFI